MTISKKQKRWIIILGIIVSVFLVFVLAINLILANIISKKITNALENRPDKNYHITLDKVRVNILNGNINLKGLQIEPDSVFVDQLKQGKLNQSMVLRAHLPLFRLAGFSLYDAATDGKIDIRKILFKNANVQILVGKKKQQPKASQGIENEKGFRLDSIQIPGVQGIEIGKIELEHFKIEFYDVVKNTVISKNKKLNLVVTGIESIKLSEGSDYFAFGLQNGQLELSEEEFKLPGGNYMISLKKLKLNLPDSSLTINNFVLKPQIADRFKMAEKLVYTKGIFDVAVKEINLTSIDVLRMIHEGELVIGNVQVNGMHFDLFKDKRKPWDYDLRPKYFNQALRTMDFPVYIGSIGVEEGYLKYWEESAKSFGNLEVTLHELEGTILHVTSIKDSLRKPMTANLRARLFNTAPMSVDFLLPLNSRVDTFFVSGSLGKSKMSKFNPALFPALGMNITGGTLNSVAFKARANRKYIDGEMVMMYDGLETEVAKKKDQEVNKFVSWLANSVVIKSNPGKKDKLRTVPMHFEREMYKGMINVVWKAVQTGLVNTISPTGKVIKETKPEEKPETKTKEESGKKKKSRRKKDKK